MKRKKFLILLISLLFLLSGTFLPNPLYASSSLIEASCAIYKKMAKHDRYGTNMYTNMLKEMLLNIGKIPSNAPDAFKARTSRDLALATLAVVMWTTRTEYIEFLKKSKEILESFNQDVGDPILTVAMQYLNNAIWSFQFGSKDSGFNNLKCLMRTLLLQEVSTTPDPKFFISLFQFIGNQLGTLTSETEWMFNSWQEAGANFQEAGLLFGACSDISWKTTIALQKESFNQAVAAMKTFNFIVKIAEKNPGLINQELIKRALESAYNVFNRLHEVNFQAYKVLNFGFNGNTVKP
jgi:hypothetical protein